MQEIITKIRSAQNQAQLHESGKLMRAHVANHPEDEGVLLSEFRRKSMRMVNTKRLTTNY